MMYARNARHQQLHRLLSGNQARLDTLLETLVEAFLADAHADVAPAWASFDAALRRHFSFEERHILPEFRRVDPTAAAELTHEREQLRVRLVRFGLRVELDFLRAEVVLELTHAVREHAAREERLICTWLRSIEQGPNSYPWCAEAAAAALEELIAA